MTFDRTQFQKKRLPTLVRVVLFYLSSLLVLTFTSRLTKGFSSKTADLSSLFLASVLTFILVYLFTRWEQLRLRHVGVVPGKPTLPRFVAGYAIGLLMAAAQALIVLSFGHLRLTVVTGITALEILLPFLLYLFVACREELVFRSYSLRSLAYGFSSSVALLIMVIIFILEHVMSGMTWKMAVVGSGLGGILFGVAALKTRGLALPLGLHSAWNFGQWMVGFKNKPGVWNAVVDNGYKRETENISLVAFSVVMLLTITGIALFYKRKGSEEAEGAS